MPKNDPRPIGAAPMRKGTIRNILIMSGVGLAIVLYVFTIVAISDHSVTAANRRVNAMDPALCRSYAQWEHSSGETVPEMKQICQRVLFLHYGEGV